MIDHARASGRLCRVICILRLVAGFTYIREADRIVTNRPGVPLIFLFPFSTIQHRRISLLLPPFASARTHTLTRYQTQPAYAQPRPALSHSSPSPLGQSPSRPPPRPRQHCHSALSHRRAASCRNESCEDSPLVSAAAPAAPEQGGHLVHRLGQGAPPAARPHAPPRAYEARQPVSRAFFFCLDRRWSTDRRPSALQRASRTGARRGVAPAASRQKPAARTRCK